MRENHPQQPASISPWVVISIGILAVSTASIFIRFAQTEASSLVIAAYRLTVASLVIAPMALLRHREEIMRLTRKQVLALGATGLVLALHFVSWIQSLAYTSVATSVVLVTTTPLWVALFSPLVLKERISKRVTAGLILALLGGAVVSLNDSCSFHLASSGLKLACTGFSSALHSQALLGNGLALLGALCAAAYMLAGRSLRSTLSIETYTFGVYGSAAVALLLACAVTGQRMVGYQAQTYLWLIALGLVPQLLGHSSFNWALKYLPAATVSITLLGEPIGSTLLALVLLAERPGPLELFGGVFILVGIYLCAR
jgi:drug/metabolite transporter (DMT)-like permease